MPLFWKSFLANAVTLGVAVMVLILSPATVSHPVSVVEAAVLGVGMIVIFAVNAWLVRRTLGPLERLRRSLDGRETTDDPERLEPEGTDEVASLATSYNAMLDRLDAERENTVRQALSAQEEERARVSSELHDEVGQALTALLLRLTALSERWPEPARSELVDLRESVRSTLQEVRSIAGRLRPGVLTDLGLLPALRGLAHGIEDATSLRVRLDLAARCAIPPETELVLYRVAQESLTNVVRHAEARHVELSLRVDEGRVVLCVADDGTGRAGTPGTGRQGMQERARLVHGRLDVTAVLGRGTTVTLEIPHREEAGCGPAPGDPAPRPPS